MDQAKKAFRELVIEFPNTDRALRESGTLAGMVMADNGIEACRELLQELATECAGTEIEEPANDLLGLLDLPDMWADTKDVAARIVGVRANFYRKFNPDLAVRGICALGVLDAIVEGYWQKPQRSDADKYDLFVASQDRAYYVFLRRSKEHVERVAAQMEEFIDRTKEDRSVSPLFGGIPYGVFVHVHTRLELARLFKKLDMYDRALREYDKIDAAITPAILKMATTAPAEGSPGSWDLQTIRRSYRRYLEWTRDTLVKKGIVYCKDKVSVPPQTR